MAALILVSHVDNTNSENDEHEAKLMGLWKTLQPEELKVLRVWVFVSRSRNYLTSLRFHCRAYLKSRKTKAWGKIGFQGADPATDFRAMGLCARSLMNSTNATATSNDHSNNYYPQ